jgi:Mrp family chromosome partitioning ATPase
LTSPVSSDQSTTNAALERSQLTVGKLAGTLVGVKPEPSIGKEAYDLVLHKITLQPLRRRMLFVTSAAEGEGTTTTAANLAGVLSQRGQAVLLAELRLTKPKLLEIMGRPDHVVGFEEGLLGHVPLHDCTFQIAGDAMHVLAVGKAMGHEEAAQQSGALNEFVVWAEKAFDWVVLDCPPVTAIEWTRWFELNADPAVLVARSKATETRTFKKAARRLGDHLAGALLNDRQDF